jgi:hypothetical protein
VRQTKDTNRRVAALAATAVMLVLAGCGQAAGPPAASDTPTAAAPEGHVSDKPSNGSDGPSRGVAADAMRDLSRRLGVDPAEVTVVSAEEVTWRDASLGCPRPGMMYPQVLTDGSRVVLEARGKRYEYHAGGRRSAFLCENPEPPAGR